MDDERLKMTRLKVERIEGTELDPELWQRLPEDMLERVIAKLPFSRAVDFRRVCKKWYSDIVPRATAQLETSNSSALLYFWFHKYRGSARWRQVCNGKSESAQEFQSKSFPTPRSGETVQLLICERGLLFFGFLSIGNELLRDIVICNPLISKSKSLCLPRPLRMRNCPAFLVGATFDSETRSYCLVSSGKDENFRNVTFLYDSQTCSWKNGSTPEAAFDEVSDGTVLYYETRHRSFCCMGNLCWPVWMVSVGDALGVHYVLRFDNQHGTWSVIPQLIKQCDNNIFEFLGDFHAPSSRRGEILSWHMHRNPIMSQDGPPQLLSCELFDGSHVKPPQYIDWPCRSDRAVGLAPEMKLMPHSIMETIYRFLHKLACGRDDFRYQAFSQENFIYHAALGHFGLAVLVQDTDKNSFTELPKMPCNWIPVTNWFPRYWNPDFVWSFSASLTSLP